MPTATVDEVVRRLLDSPARLGTGRLLCVDGPSGSGKTTLATAVTAALTRRPGLTVHLSHMDDHYQGWSGLADVDTRVRDEILAPLAAGQSGRYRRYDWEAGRFAEPHVVPVVDVLVLEGVGAGSSLLAPYRGLLVWVHAARDLRRSRGLARDGDSFAPHWDRWAIDEAEHFATHDTRAAADLSVDGHGCLG